MQTRLPSQSNKFAQFDCLALFEFNFQKKKNLQKTIKWKLLSGLSWNLTKIYWRLWEHLSMEWNIGLGKCYEIVSSA